MELRGFSVCFSTLAGNGCVCEQCALPSLPGDVRWQDGKVSGTVYSGEEKLTHLLVKVKCRQANFASSG